MTEDLKKLVEMAKSVEMSGSDKEEQRRSFAFGNTSIENPRITRDIVDQQAETIEAAKSTSGEAAS